MTDAAAVVQVSDLTVRFGSFTALNAVSFVLRQGSIAGLIGPNGAGKTTLMRCLAGLQPLSAGRALLFDKDVSVQPREVRKRLGYLPDSGGLYPDMRVTEYLDFFSAAYGLDKRDAARFRERALTLSGLKEKAACFVEALSLGMRAKLSFVKILAHDPDLLILDEPLSGLDPAALAEMLSLLRSLRNEGKTILISSHLLSNLEKVCDDIVFLNRGELVKDDDSDKSLRYLVRGRGNAAVREGLQTLKGVANVSITDAEAADVFFSAELTLTAHSDPADVLRGMVVLGADVVEWRPLVESLDARLLRVIGKKTP